MHVYQNLPTHITLTLQQERILQELATMNKNLAAMNKNLARMNENLRNMHKDIKDIKLLFLKSPQREDRWLHGKKKRTQAAIKLWRIPL